MQQQQQIRIVWPKAGRTIIALIIANLVAYVLQLVLLHAGAAWVEALYMVPAQVLHKGYVWQLFTYSWLHSPSSPSHLLFNMVFLWMFGSKLESWWGERRLLIAYFIFGLGGGLLTLIVGGLMGEPYALRPHLGASGAVMGLTIAWGLTFAEQEFHFLLIGRMKGKTFVWIAVAFELLTALSFNSVSSTSHFGGMIAAFILVRGLWRPSRWRMIFSRRKLERQRKQVEAQLRVLEGGNKGPARPRPGGGWGVQLEELDPPDPKDPSRWN